MNQDEPDEAVLSIASEHEEHAEEPVADFNDEQQSVEENEIYAIFDREAGQHLGVIDEFLGATAGQESAPLTDDLYRALHTLKGSAHMAELPHIADIASAAEGLVKTLREHDLVMDAEVAELLDQVAIAIRGGLGQLSEDPNTPLSGEPELVESLGAYVKNHPALQGESEAVEQPRATELVVLLQQNMDAVSDRAVLL